MAWPRVLLYNRRRSRCWISIQNSCVVLWSIVKVRGGGPVVRSMSSAAATPRHPTAVKIAVAQVCSTASKWSNLCNVARCAGWAMCKTIDTATLLHSNESSSSSNSNPPDDDPCRMLFLPECFGFLGSSVDQTILAAEDDISRKTTTKTIKNGENISNALTRIVRHHATTGTNDHSREMDLDDVMLSDEEDRKLSLWDGLQTIAKASNLWISAGGMHVRAAATDGTVDGQQPRVYNTHVIVDNHGVLRAKYRKIHLFDVFIPGQVDLRESKSTQAGTELVACPDSPIGCLGVTVCYDLRFPEMYTQLVQTMGAQILLIPSAFTVPTGRAHWHTLLRARAIENQCYVIAAAQYGQHNEKRESYGHSLVVDPWGTVLVDAGGVDSELGSSVMKTPSIVTCHIDINTVSSVRERMPIQQHRGSASF